MMFKSPLTGKPFLQLQHGPSCPDQVSKDVFHLASTFREDYRYHSNSGASERRKQYVPPPPASVIHKNECFMELEGSLTQDTYRPSPRTDTGVKTSRAATLNKTNFHMNADRRLETLQTTNQTGFPQPAHDRDTRIYHCYKDVDRGPLGKRVFNPSVNSEYNSMYHADGGSVKNVKGAGLSLCSELLSNSRNTITGSRKAVIGEDHVTTHCDTYRGETLMVTNSPSNTAKLQQLRVTSIPLGDSTKAASPPTSNTRLSYTQTSPGQSSQYNKSKAVQEILGASIRLGDHTQSPDKYFSTTATDTYCEHTVSESKKKSNKCPNCQKKIVTFKDVRRRECPSVRFPRNASFLPGGDLDPARTHRRITHSTTKQAHTEPPTGSFPVHVNSSGLRTLSHFDIGGSGDSTYLSSTMASSYHPVCQATHRVRAPPFDNLPLHYYHGHLCRSTTSDSYPRHTVNSRSSQINKVALENLKCSHWSLPRMTDRPSH